MIRSMTAFARGESESGGFRAMAELRSVNHRYCEVFVRIPRTWAALEERVKAQVRETAARGRIEVSLEIRDERGRNVEFVVDEHLARAYHDALDRVRTVVGSNERVPLSTLVRLDGVVSARSGGQDIEADWAVISAAMAEALAALDAMRRTEGEALEREFTGRLTLLESLLGRIEEDARDLPALQKIKFAERIAALTDGVAGLDETRLAQEAAVFADKSDITEEIVRAKSHIAQFRDFLAQGTAAGRSLNFLVQELHREFNTMGSKSCSAPLSHAVVDAKAEIEKLREQIQNVE